MAIHAAGGVQAGDHIATSRLGRAKSDLSFKDALDEHSKDYLRRTPSLYRLLCCRASWRHLEQLTPRQCLFITILCNNLRSRLGWVVGQWWGGRWL